MSAFNKILTSLLTFLKPSGILLFFIFLVFPIKNFAQLTPFILSVSSTSETCLGNGQLNFNVFNSTPSATITFTVFKLPNEITPIAFQTNLLLTGQTSGNYKIVATQSLGSEQNSQTAFATITNAIQPLNYFITSTNSTCNNGTLTATIVSGFASLYEIISGPVTKPLQNSPTFIMLPAGIYQIRVFDICNDATVITHTLSAGTSSLTIGSVNFPEAELPTCTSILVSNNISSNATINYPLSLNYVITTPSGATQTIVQTVSSGNASSYDANFIIPFFYDQIYSYDLTVLDGCGNTYTLNNNQINLKLIALLIGDTALCGTNFLSVGAAIYTPNLQINFLQFPIGFNPSTFNSSHPGPFSESQISYGSSINPVPFGFYQIQISDGCGNSAAAEVTLTQQDAVPNHDAVPNLGCDSNRSKVTIRIPNYLITNAIITVAPFAFGSVPSDITALINSNGVVEIENLITGDYTVVLVDDCGNSYTYSFFVADVTTSVSATSWSGCELGKGSIRIRGNNTLLVAVIIENAPDTFIQNLPFNASSNISSDGIFSLANLLPGTFTFKVLDNCGLENSSTVVVEGYQITSDNFELTPRCGSFDIFLAHDSNAISEFFWIQKLNPVTGNWEHPATGIIYPENTIPNSSNSFSIQNNNTNLNLTFLGHFRILKSFQTFDNGAVGSFKTCVELLREFKFTGEIEFTGIEKLNCNGINTDVKLFAIGAPPLVYSIVAKDGLPFFLDNGFSSTFTNLVPAVYTFRVQQACGDSRDFISDIAQLPSLTNANQANLLFTCDDDSNDGKETFNLSQQDLVILGNQSANLYTITYHLNLSDANSNSNALPLNYNSNSSTIYARLQLNTNTSCYDISSFGLFVNPFEIQQKRLVNLCEGESVDLIAGADLNNLIWSTGEFSPTISVSSAGIYTLNAAKNYNLGSCSVQIVYEVLVFESPEDLTIETRDWTNNQNVISVFVSNGNTTDYLYSLDGINFQESSVFENLNSGFYTIYVKDKADCGKKEKNIVLLNYPEFFTPNGDGINDTWSVSFSQVEPKMTTEIYDRFGKLLSVFTPQSSGWDGTYNGRMVPSTDYWFVITRENGKIYRGHFAMKR